MLHKLYLIFQTCPGLEQYAIQKFAQALETMPKILAENTGVKATEVLSQLYAAHQEGKSHVGVDVEVGLSFIHNKYSFSLRKAPIVKLPSS